MYYQYSHYGHQWKLTWKKGKYLLKKNLLGRIKCFFKKNSSNYLREPFYSMFHSNDVNIQNKWETIAKELVHQVFHRKCTERPSIMVCTNETMFHNYPEIRWYFMNNVGKTSLFLASWSYKISPQEAKPLLEFKIPILPSSEVFKSMSTKDQILIKFVHSIWQIFFFGLKVYYWTLGNVVNTSNKINSGNETSLTANDPSPDIL